MFSCHVCKGGGNSDFCVTPDCGSCVSGGTCDSGGPGIILREQAPEAQIASDRDRKRLFRIDTSVIREIGDVHPRFAATLANLNAFGLTFVGVYHVNWTPVELAPQDVEAFLDRGHHPGFFKRYDRKVHRLNKLIEQGRLEDIVYDVTIEESADSSNRTIKLSLQKGSVQNKVDPPYSSLEVKVTNVNAASRTEQTSTWYVK